MLNYNKGSFLHIGFGILHKVYDWEVLTGEYTVPILSVVIVLGKKASSKIATIQAADVFVDQRIDFCITQNKDQSA